MEGRKKMGLAWFLVGLMAGILFTIIMIVVIVNSVNRNFDESKDRHDESKGMR